MTRFAATGRFAVAAFIVAAASNSSPRLVRRETRSIRISQFAFDPAEARVVSGDTVVWENADILAHTTAEDSGAWSSGEIKVGARFTLVAKDTGRFEYHCAAHPTMHGVLIVQ